MTDEIEAWLEDLDKYCNQEYAYGHGDYQKLIALVRVYRMQLQRCTSSAGIPDPVEACRVVIAHVKMANEKANEIIKS